MEPEGSSPQSQVHFFVSQHDTFYGEGLLAPRPTPKLGDGPLSAVRDCLFNILAAAFNIGGRSSIRNLRTYHVLVTGTQLSRMLFSDLYANFVSSAVFKTKYGG
jgi:hypothetical protein